MADSTTAELAPAAPLRFFYHGGLPGRGEFVRMVLEDGGVAYVDLVRDEGLDGGEVRLACSAFSPRPVPLETARPFAPPFIELPDGTRISQTANLMLFVAESCGLAPEERVGKARLLGLLLFVMDVVAEVHDCHHPVSTKLYYEEQKEEAKRKSVAFTTQRMAQYLGHLDETLAANGGPWLLGAQCSAGDIAVLQLMLGLHFSFPKAYARSITPALLSLVERVKQRPKLSVYLASTRRAHFNHNGIFRSLPELDLPDEEPVGEEPKRAAASSPTREKRARGPK